MNRASVSILVDGIEGDKSMNWHGYVRLRVKCYRDDGATTYTVENHVPGSMPIEEAVKLSLRRFHFELADMKVRDWFKPKGGVV